jgi:hypothetical protein
MAAKAHLNGGEVVFFCPGCQCGHGVRFVKVPICGDQRNPKRPEKVWEWNGSMDAPTLFPSLLYVGICHSWVRDGKISFMPDSAHALKGKNDIDLPDWED